MKAVVCREFGTPAQLEVAELESLRPGAGQVVIDVKASSVNFPDVLIVAGKYQVVPPLPFTPGNDVAGVVSAVGEGVTHLTVGMPVLGIVGTGGFAEEALADAATVIPLPAGIAFETAAAFGLTYSTSYYALKDRAQIQPGETLLVLGAAGGVGLAAVELGRLLGARVIAAASSDEKLAVCREYGAEAVINYSTQDLREQIKHLTGGKGVDVVYDAVGGPFAEQALRSTAWNGRFLVVGFAAGEIPRIPLNLPLLKGCSVVGVFWGNMTQREPQRNIQNLRELAGLLATGKITPRISATYPLTAIAQALDDVQARRAIGKVIVLPEG